jgi:hypothetical protein
MTSGRGAAYAAVHNSSIMLDRRTPEFSTELDRGKDMCDVERHINSETAGFRERPPRAMSRKSNSLAARRRPARAMRACLLVAQLWRMAHFYRTTVSLSRNIFSTHRAALGFHQRAFFGHRFGHSRMKSGKSSNSTLSSLPSTRPRTEIPAR